jgi:hypothetical protein
MKKFSHTEFSTLKIVNCTIHSFPSKWEKNPSHDNKKLESVFLVASLLLRLDSLALGSR